MEDAFQVLSQEIYRLYREGALPSLDLSHRLAAIRTEFDRLERQRKELASLYEVAQELSSVTELNALLQSIIDRAIILVGAERGFVVLSNTQGEYEIKASRDFATGQVEDKDRAFSSSLVGRVIRSQQPILTTNVQEDDRFELTQSILVQNIRSVLAVPLVASGELQGAVYVDTRLSVRHFSEDELGALQAMASQAAMAIRNARLYEDLKHSNAQLREALDQLRETQGQLVQAERLAAVGQLAASVAHELRNPLMVMRNALYFLDRLTSRPEPPDMEVLKRYFGKLDGEIDRQTKIINDLLFFSRNRPRKLAEVDLNAVLQETITRIAMPDSVVVRQQLAPALQPIRGDPEQLQQVFINLITNAVQAMPDGGTVTVITRLEDGSVAVDVADTGTGISPEHLKRLFEPFFTTKEKGIGLGLAVTHGLVQGHRGTIDVTSTVGKGTTFTVRLPLDLIG